MESAVVVALSVEAVLDDAVVLAADVVAVVLVVEALPGTLHAAREPARAKAAMEEANRDQKRCDGDEVEEFI
jgi:hypothetical protein